MRELAGRLASYASLFPRRGIGRRLLGPLLLCVVALIAGTTTVETRRLQAMLHASVATEMALAEAIVVEPLSEALWEFDPDAARASLRGLEAMQYFHGAEVWMEDDGETPFIAAGKALGTQGRLPEGVIQTEIPLSADGTDAIGTLHLVFDMSAVHAEIAAVRRGVVGMGLVVTFCAAAVVCALSVSIVRPIQGVVAEIARLRDGASVEIESAKRQDELGQIGRALVVLQRMQADRARLEEAARRRDAAEAERDRAAVEEEAGRLRERERERDAMEAARLLREDERRAEDAARAERMREQEDVVSTLADALRRVASGDLTATVEAPFGQAYEPLRRDYNVAVGRLSVMVGTIAQSVEALSGQAQSISGGAQDLAERTEAAGTALRMTRKATADLSASAQASAGETERFAVEAASARDAAATDRRIVGKTVEAMAAVRASSDTIGSATGTISDIAFQTGLLSLNAGIEAARAGPAGAGFGVVASAVRDLAQRAAEVANDIGGVVMEGETAVNDSLERVADAEAAFDRVGRDIEALAQRIRAVAKATTEQSALVAEIEHALTEIDVAIRESTSMSVDSASTGDSLLAEAERLRGLVAGFSIAEASPTGDRSRAA